MEIYSIGFTQKSAGEFFGTLKEHGIERLLDVRLNNTSQLSGFAKRADLAYFLGEICGAVYEHEPLLAPTQVMLDTFKKQKGDWNTYVGEYLNLIQTRRVEEVLVKEAFKKRTVLLCSEPSAGHCHRRLALEYLQQYWEGIVVRHL